MYVQKYPLKLQIEFISIFKYTYIIMNDLINIYRILHSTNAEKYILINRTCNISQDILHHVQVIVYVKT